MDALCALALLLAVPRVTLGQDAQPTVTPAAAAPIADSVLATIRRAQRLVNDGSGAEGRALLDSLLERTEPRSAAEAEVLFWRATLAESWDNAQRDYLRLMLEHDRSQRAADAMLRLAQGEVARGDRDAALRYLERLAREAPESGARAEAGLWQGRLLIDRGAQTEGCAVLRAARTRVRPGAIELENQYSFLMSGCAAEVATAPTPAHTTPPMVPVPVPDTRPPSQPATPAPTPAVTPPPAPPATGMIWSVQVAAFGTKAEADDFAGEVRELGYDARVDGGAAPFRVRFGRYPTRAAAQTAMTDYKAKARADAFLVQVPRG